MFVDVYSRRTGRKLPKPVPEHWLEHEVLGANLSRLPSRTAGQTDSADDTDLVIVDGLGQDPSTDEESTTTITETPAAGDEKE